MTDDARQERLAALIDQRRGNQASGPTRSSTAEPAPLTSVQLSFWTIAALEGARSVNRPTAAHLDGRVDTATLKAALEAVVQRHEPLRTRYPFSGDEPAQELVDAQPVELQQRNASSGGLEAATREEIKRARAMDHDMEAEALFAPVLISESPVRHTLVIAVSHIAFDGWSEALFWHELGAVYQATLDGSEPDLATAPITFTDYARWERAQLDQGDPSRALAFWRNELGDLNPTPEVPVLGRASNGEAHVCTEIEPELMGAVRSTASQAGSTPFVVILAALELLTRRLLASDDFAILCPVAGRDRPETNDLIGCFINQIHLRARCEPHQTLGAHLDAVNRRFLAAYQQRDVPVQRVLDHLGGNGRHPDLSRVSLQWRDFPEATTAASDLNIQPLVTPTDVSGLSFSIRLVEPGATLDLDFAPDRLDEHAALAVCAELKNHMWSICTSPEALVGPNEPITRTSLERSIPLSFGQQRLWFLEQLEPNSPAYLVPHLRRLHGALDTAALETAAQVVIERHQVLRTQVDNRGGVPVARLRADTAPSMVVHDLRHLAQPERESEARRLIVAAFNEPIDLALDPMVRMLLARVADEEWIWMLAIHHIAVDAESFDILFEELGIAYERGADALSSLPSMEAQFADFARSQRDRAASGDYERQLSYWDARLADPLPDHTFGRIAPGGRETSVVAAKSLPLGGRLKAVAAESGVTPHMLGLAAWTAILADEANTERVLLANVVSDRWWPPSDGLIGYFVNTLPLLVDCDRSHSLIEAARSVRRCVMDDLSHGDVPLDLIAERLRPRGINAGDLIGAVDYQLVEEALSSEHGLPGLVSEALEVPGPAPKFDLSLQLTLDDDQLGIRVVGRGSHFDERQIERLAVLCEQRLTRCLSDPSSPLRDPLGSLAPGRILEQARRRPHKAAVSSLDENLSYAELAALAAGIARSLTAAGVEPGTRVGLLTERRPAMVAAILGAWWAGLAYVPLDPTQPASRWNHIAADAELAAVMTDRPDSAVGLVGDVPCIVIGETAPDARWDERPGPAVGPDTPAYVIYTSGSSGEPKGVVVPHRALGAFIDGAAPVYGTSDTDVCLQFHSIAFDVSVEELTLALTHGASVVLRPDDLIGSAQRLLDFCGRQAITTLTLPTAYWHEMARQLADATDSAAPFPSSLHTVIVGGEAMQLEALDRWQHIAPQDVRLINSYGPTECTISVAAEILDGAPTAPVTVGRPFRTVRLRIVDQGGQMCPPGEWGELMVGGPQLATEYLNRADQTAEVFVNDETGQRWYHTGDRARIDAHGRIEIGSRLDDQVKVHGHRVEPSEVEALLRLVPHIAEAGIVVRDHNEGAELHAFVTLAAGHSSSADEAALRPEVAKVAPAAMVPRTITVLDELPVGVGGKVDRSALRTMANQGRPAPIQPSESVQAADGPTVETRLMSIWEELLATPISSPETDFFAAGGDSMRAVRLVHLLQAEFGIDLPVASVFDARTLGALAAQITHGLEGSAPTQPEATAAAADSAVATHPTRLHLDRAPLSLAQQRIWLHQQMRTEALSYLIPVAWELRGPLDEQALREALEALVRRHEILRTRIVDGPGGRPLQLIDPPSPDGEFPHVSREDLSALSPDDRVEAAARLRATFHDKTFDLPVEHPFRCLLIRIDPQHHVLALSVHHLAADDDAIGILQAELTELYGTGKADTVPALQFADFSVWQRARLAEGAHRTLAEQWKHELGPEPTAIELPGRLLDGAPCGVIADHDLALSESTTRKLLALAEEAGASTFQTVLSLLDAVLFRLTSNEQLIVGAPGSERRVPALAPMIGPLVNLLVIHTQIDGSHRFNDLLRRVRADVATSLDRAELPFDTLVDELQLPRDPSRLPLLSVILATDDLDGDALFSLDGLEVAPLPYRGEGGFALTDLMVNASLRDGRLQLSMRHDEGILESWVVEQIVSAFEQVATVVTETPLVPIDDIDIVLPRERDWLINTLNDTEVDYPSGQRIDATFLDVARKYPSAVAVSDGSRQVSYTELDIESDLLANHLRQIGVGAGDAVGVELDRSIDLVVALVAVLRAGGTYVPLDRAAPPGRRHQVLTAAGARAVVTPGDGSMRVEPIDQQRPALPPIAEPPAYVMFTSGSTGVPKGVAIPHRAVQRLVHGVTYAELGPKAVLAMVSNPAFDALTFEVWGALLTGGRIEVIDQDTLTNPIQFAEALASRGVTAMFLTTSMTNLIAQTAPNAFTTLDTLMVGGEAVEPETMRRLTQVGPRRLVNGYGPTECTTFAAWHLVDKVAPGARTVPIGSPTTNTQLYVLDARGRLVPRGVVAELHIGGPGLGLGYVGDPDLTAQRFVTIPINGRPTRLYRTGDLVRRRRDGAIEYLGRRDHQVKLRGFRIELGDVETALKGADGVEMAAAKIVGIGGKRRLVAYLSGQAEQRPDSDALRQQLAQVLPAYMVPAQFVFMDALPLTSTGKIDRQGLPEPAESATAEDVTRPVADPVLERVLALWRGLLVGASITPTSDFFELGGNSLLAVELLSGVEEHFDVSIRLSQMFDARTPSQLANMIKEHTRPVAPHHVVTLRAGSASPEPPLWLMHPAGGSLVLYEPLADSLDQERRIMGVEALGLDGETDPATTIDEAVEHQLSNILQAQQNGPFRLVGYSVGGLIAIEVARRLLAVGHEVDYLGVIEAGIPDPEAMATSRWEIYRSRYRNGGVSAVTSHLAENVRRRVERTPLRSLLPPRQADNYAEVLAAMVDAFHGHEPTPVAVRATLFLGDESPGDPVDKQLTELWQRLALEGLHVRRVSGSHDDDSILREPHAKVLAKALEEELTARDGRAAL